MGKAKGSQAQLVSNTDEVQKIKDISMQFLDGNDEEEEEGLDADFFKVKCAWVGP